MWCLQLAACSMFRSMPQKMEITVVEDQYINCVHLSTGTSARAHIIIFHRSWRTSLHFLESAAERPNKFNANND
jgi:hypothetical protein